MATLPYQAPGFHSVTPSLTISGAAAALAFYKEAFLAKEATRYETAEGKIGHAEIVIGDSRVMLSDEFPEWGALSPQTVGGVAGSLMIYVPDADAAVARAVGAGAKLLMPVEDQFYGDRCGRIEDPFGHRWTLATHKKELSNEELSRRASEQYGMTFRPSAED